MGDHEGSEELEQLRAEPARAQAQLTEQQEQLTATKTKLADAELEAETAYEHAKTLEAELDNTWLRAEVEKLRKVDTIRKEFDIERKQLRELDVARITELKASMAVEKEKLLKRVNELEKQLAEGASASPSSSGSSSESVRMPEEPGGGVDHTHDRPADEHESSGGGDDHTHDDDSGHTHESTGEHISDSHEPADSNSDDDGHSSTSATGSSDAAGSGVMQSVARLLEEHRIMMAAHSIPPLRKFTGEDAHTHERCFERWLEQFEDRAKMASWSDEQRLFQLKAHLEKTAEHAVRMLSASEKSTYKAVVAALEHRFYLLDIEELRGLEFHQLMQNAQSVEEVGIQLHRLT